jgi:hypothetical protein
MDPETVDLDGTLKDLPVLAINKGMLEPFILDIR